MNSEQTSSTNALASSCTAASRKRPIASITMEDSNYGMIQHCQPMKSLSASITLPIGTRVDDLNTLSSIIHKTALASSMTSASIVETAATPTRMDNKNMISSPADFFTAMLQARGYPATTVCSLKCGYHNSPTKHQTTSYGFSLTKAIRSSDTITARSLLSAGLHPNACNKFGESIVHAACRRGDFTMLRALLEAGSTVQVTDDFGRTPLHDACWTSSPNFDTIRLLLDQDPWLLCIMDCRGSTPLGYVRKAHWGLWIGFLGAIADRYWPDLNDDGHQEGKIDRPIAPPLAFEEPNSRPIPDPKGIGLALEVIELLANGNLTPQELDDKGNVHPETYQATREISNPPTTTTSSSCSSRITLDPFRQNGSNATTMFKGSQNAANNATLMQGYVKVMAP